MYKRQERHNQKDVLREDVEVDAAQLLDVAIQGGRVTEAGYRGNIRVALEYLSSWLSGTGAAAISNLMEDAATAEISRSQLWQWARHGVSLEDGRTASADLYRSMREEEVTRLSGATASPRLDEAAELLDSLVLADEFMEFLTLPAYSYLD